MSSNPCAIATQPDDLDGDNRWLSIHKRFLQECREKDPESKKTWLYVVANYRINNASFAVLFVGDDILEGLSFTEVYRSFEEMHLLNFSIRNDKTQHILWRLKNGELENIKPKVSCTILMRRQSHWKFHFQIIVLHCGTNNSPFNSGDEIAEGIAECVSLIRTKHAESFIVIPTLLPRGHQPNSLREKNEKINDILKEKLQSVSKVQIVDISKGLIQTDGTISHHDLHDYLNLTNAASKKLFEPVWDLLHQILTEDEKEELLTPTE